MPSSAAARALLPLVADSVAVFPQRPREQGRGQREIRQGTHARGVHDVAAIAAASTTTTRGGADRKDLARAGARSAGRPRRSRPGSRRRARPPGPRGRPDAAEVMARHCAVADLQTLAHHARTSEPRRRARSGALSLARIVRSGTADTLEPLSTPLAAAPAVRPRAPHLLAWPGERAPTVDPEDRRAPCRVPRSRARSACSKAQPDGRPCG